MTKTETNKRYSVQEVTANLNKAVTVGKAATFGQIAALVLLHEGLNAQEAQTLARKTLMHAGYTAQGKGNSTTSEQLPSVQSDWLKVARLFHKTEEAQHLILNALTLEVAQSMLTELLCKHSTFTALKRSLIAPKEATQRVSVPQTAGKLAQRALENITKLLLSEPDIDTTAAIDAFFRSLESSELIERKQVHAAWQRQRMVVVAEKRAAASADANAHATANAA